jgi:mono/diheme cytochrome c family protein
MNKWVKRGGITVLGVVAVGVAAVLVGAWMGERKMQRRVDIDVKAVAFSDDPASVERGRYLFLSRGCAECHGANGAGKDVINDGKGLLIHAPNITRFPGAVAATYTALDWTRTLRHGIKPNGQPVIVMPSEDYARLTDADVAAIVAHLRQLAPVEGGPAQIQFPLPLKVLYAVGFIQDASEKIDHSMAPPPAIPEGVTAQHGAYVANACIGCHGATLSGGKIPGTPPDWPPAANLTPGEGSALARYPNPDAFIAMLRTGKRPDGSAVSTVMPFGALKVISDTDAQALYLHLQSLPPKPAGRH